MSVRHIAVGRGNKQTEQIIDTQFKVNPRAPDSWGPHENIVLATPKAADDSQRLRALTLEQYETTQVRCLVPPGELS